MMSWKNGSRLALLSSLGLVGALLSGCKDATEPNTPANIQVMAGNSQVAAAAAAVPVPPSVKITTASGKPVKGVTVTFAPATGSGTVVGGTQLTDALGVATLHT
jgi:hypothetical protein